MLSKRGYFHECNAADITKLVFKTCPNHSQTLRMFSVVTVTVVRRIYKLGIDVIVCERKEKPNYKLQCSLKMRGLEYSPPMSLTHRERKTGISGVKFTLFVKKKLISILLGKTATGYEASYSAKVTNVWIYTSTLPCSSCRGA
jgi:hypothetical protein